MWKVEFIGAKHRCRYMFYLNIDCTVMCCRNANTRVHCFVCSLTMAPATVIWLAVGEELAHTLCIAAPRLRIIYPTNFV